LCKEKTICSQNQMFSLKLVSNSFRTNLRTSHSNANVPFGFFVPKQSFAVGPKRNLVKDMDTPKKETRMPYTFDKEQRKYISSSWTQPANQYQKLKILTWNVWFDESQYDERVKHQFQIMKALDADIISLQEVLPLYLQKLANEEWVKQNYYISEFDGTQVRSYDTVLLTKIPSKQLNVFTLHSYMSRKLYLAETEVNNEPASFVTVHMESLAKSAKIRKDQLQQIFTILKQQQNVFLFGDFNFCTSVGEDQEVDPRYKDVWATLKGSEFQPTVGTNYPKAEVKPARFDRLYLNSSSWVPTDIQLIGGTKIRQTVMKSIYPSDHLGVLGTFEYKPGNTPSTPNTTSNPSVPQSNTPAGAPQSNTSASAPQTNTSANPTPSNSTPPSASTNPTSPNPSESK